MTKASFQMNRRIAWYVFFFCLLSEHTKKMVHGSWCVRSSSSMCDAPTPRQENKIRSEYVWYFLSYDTQDATTRRNMIATYVPTSHVIRSWCEYGRYGNGDVCEWWTHAGEFNVYSNSAARAVFSMVFRSSDFFRASKCKFLQDDGNFVVRKVDTSQTRRCL